MSDQTLGKVIIVGGGIGGIHVARTLNKSCNKKTKVDVTVVDRQNYLDWCIASPRSVVAPDDVDKFNYCMPLKEVCQFVGASFVHSAVSKIGEKSVTLESGKVLEADVIVVAIGGQYASGAIWKALPEHTTKEVRIAAFRQLNERIKQAKSIVVAGAGPTGVEVAGEIKAAYPDTVVTMVGSLLPQSPPALQTRMTAALEGMGVVVMSDGRVDVDKPDENGTVKMRSGDTIENVDLVLNAAGFSFSGASLADEKLASDVTTRGQFTCRPTLQLEHVDTVFCVGDIVAVPEGCYADVKGSVVADTTAETVAANIVLLLQQKPLKEFAWSKKPVQTMMTALGPKIAVGYFGLPNFMENFLGRKFKCKDYYMSMKASIFGKGKTWK